MTEARKQTSRPARSNTGARHPFLPLSGVRPGSADALDPEQLRSSTTAAAAKSPLGLPELFPLGRSTLQEQAYQQLRGAVMGGIFKPGTVITIRAVADALGTSPMPVRAALQRLEAEGALKALGGNRSLTIPAMTPAEYLELVDIGILLEGLAAERAAERITAAEIGHVEDACRDMQSASAAGDRDAYVTANWAFHMGIYRASHMHTLLSMIERRWLRTGPYVRFQAPSVDRMLDSMPNHWHALDAIRVRDGAAARQAIANDLRESADRLLTILHDPVESVKLNVLEEEEGEGERMPV